MKPSIKITNPCDVANPVSVRILSSDAQRPHERITRVWVRIPEGFSHSVGSSHGPSGSCHTIFLFKIASGDDTIYSPRPIEIDIMGVKLDHDMFSSLVRDELELVFVPNTFTSFWATVEG